MHISIPIQNSVEIIEQTEISPLISKCQIKVCWVGDTENRNDTVISKSVATEMGKKLPGSPIVGYYCDETEDFDSHTRDLDVKDGKIVLIDKTKPYGFVDVNAKVWFQTFLDDDGVEREYLVTEGYLWTSAYPESQRIIDKGNNQSMELDRESTKGVWAKSINDKNRIFIINEALIEKLCILGENVEPCFEGAQISSEFSLEKEFAEFKNTMFNMIKEIFDKGGEAQMNINENSVVETEEIVVEEEVVTFEEETPAEEVVEEVIETEEEPVVEEEVVVEEETPEEPVNYELLYTELLATHEELQTNYSALNTQYEELKTENVALSAFKAEKEREEKQAMINRFYMLSDEDKKDVVENIDTYSLEDIESKLSVICVRNKVSFAVENEESEEELTYSLNDTVVDQAPAWVQAARQFN